MYQSCLFETQNKFKQTTFFENPEFSNLQRYPHQCPGQHNSASVEGILAAETFGLLSLVQLFQSKFGISHAKNGRCASWTCAACWLSHPNGSLSSPPFQRVILVQSHLFLYPKHCSSLRKGTKQTHQVSMVGVRENSKKRSLCRWLPAPLQRLLDRRQVGASSFGCRSWHASVQWGSVSARQCRSTSG